MLQTQPVNPVLIVMVKNLSVKQALVVIMMLAMMFAFLIQVCNSIFILTYDMYVNALQAVFVGKQRGIKIPE